MKVDNVPDGMVAALRKRARRDRRSLNGEILSIFDWAIVHDGTESATNPAAPRVRFQKREMEELLGSWDDSRPTGEIIAEIQAARTAGREMPL